MTANTACVTSPRADAAQLTRVRPSGKSDRDAGTQWTVAPTFERTAYGTCAPPRPPASTVTEGGKKSGGPSARMTVTGNEPSTPHSAGDDRLADRERRTRGRPATHGDCSSSDAEGVNGIRDGRRPWRLHHDAVRKLQSHRRQGRAVPVAVTAEEGQAMDTDERVPEGCLRDREADDDDRSGDRDRGDCRAAARGCRAAPAETERSESLVRPVEEERQEPDAPELALPESPQSTLDHALDDERHRRRRRPRRSARGGRARARPPRRRRPSRRGRARRERHEASARHLDVSRRPEPMLL